MSNPLQGPTQGAGWGQRLYSTEPTAYQAPRTAYRPTAWGQNLYSAEPTAYRPPGMGAPMPNFGPGYGWGSAEPTAYRTQLPTLFNYPGMFNRGGGAGMPSAGRTIAPGAHI